MYRLGRVLHLSRDGNLVLKAETQPRIGDEAYNAQLRLVGVVSDVIGSTRNPYILVKARGEKVQQLINQNIYGKTRKGGRS